MATFIGYNTINQYKNYTLTDFDLIKRDLLNAFNIRQGEKVSRPLAGTTMWNLIFEPQTDKTVELVNKEIQRVVGSDPRISVGDLNVYVQDGGILVELQVQTVSNSTAQTLAVFFDQETNTASFV